VEFAVTSSSLTIADRTVVGRAGSEPRPPARRRGRSPRAWQAVRWVGPLALLLVWQIVSGSGLVPAQKLPAPTTVWQSAVGVAFNGQLGAGLEVSLRRMFLGFLAGATVGLVLGVLNGLLGWADVVLDPIVQMVRNVPLFGLIPLLILWFGIGELPKIVLISLAAGLPIYLNVHSGIRDADPLLAEAAKVLGYSRWLRLRHVVLPGATSQTLAGVRLGVASAWLALVVAETIATDSGIGYMINNARDFLRTDVVIVGLLVYALVGLLMDGAVRLIEHRVLRWRRS
jgi:sulfonate transport system permease protein